MFHRVASQQDQAALGVDGFHFDDPQPSTGAARRDPRARTEAPPQQPSPPISARDPGRAGSGGRRTGRAAFPCRGSAGRAGRAGFRGLARRPARAGGLREIVADGLGALA